MIVKAIEKGFAFGMFQHRAEVVAFLDWLRSTLRTPLYWVIEIGAHRGGTSAMFCELGANVISIDLPAGRWGGLTPEESLERTERLQKEYPETFHAVLADSHDLKTFAKVNHILQGETGEKSTRYLGPMKVDLLFIDGDHSYKGVSQDFNMYRSLVRRGGVIAFHDINDTPYHKEQGVGVPQFWESLIGRKHEFSIHEEWGGIGAVIA